MNTGYEAGLTDYLLSFTTANRRERMNSVLNLRTRYLTVVLEDIFQPHNASAVLRSCDGFGIQDVHVIENQNRFSPNKEVDMGTSQWLSIFRSSPSIKGGNCTEDTLLKLKSKGYRIIATTPHSDDTNLEEFDLGRGKAAIVFGTELDGLSDTAMSCADEYLKIPMHGFVESFNISVACALVLHHLSWKLRASEFSWKLSEGEKKDILLSWLRKTVNQAEAIENRFRSERHI